LSRLTEIILKFVIGEQMRFLLSVVKTQQWSILALCVRCSICRWRSCTRRRSTSVWETTGSLVANRSSECMQSSRCSHIGVNLQSQTLNSTLISRPPLVCFAIAHFCEISFWWKSRWKFRENFTESFNEDFV